MTTRPERPSRVSRVFGAVRESLGASTGDSPGAYEPALVERVVKAMSRLYGPGRYFDLEVRGLERIPPSPVMVVSNHSGGTSIPDVWGFACAWYQHFGPQRPLFCLAHELLFASRPTARFFERIGVLRATPTVGQEVLGELRKDLLVLPGGDREVWRAWRDRYKVKFSGRTGYAQLAHDAQVPIVPVAHAGAHETLLVLSSGERFAKWVGLRRLARAGVWPVHLSLPWGLAMGPLPHLPLPARFRYLVGEPLAPTPLPFEETDVARLDAQVRSVIQAQLDLLSTEPRAKRR